ncbi:electron-transfer flavoprotein:ubiquinone oxidoreductase [Candidatus Hodgkinia cicadicola]
MYDIIIVGAGPAGLTAAIKLKSLDYNLEVCILEKSNTIGGHLVSGTILQKSAYIKYAKQYDLSSNVLITKERMLNLNNQNAHDISWAIPVEARNKGSTLLSINELCSKMCEHAERLGVIVNTSSGVKSLLFRNNTVIGVVTVNDTKILSKHVILAEGAHGTVATKLYKLVKRSSEPQTYALGIREEWGPAPKHKTGTVLHTIGWPSAGHIELAGGFVYIYASRIAIGYITHLNYANSYICPYNEFSKFKQHPLIRSILINKQQIKYGARIISTGGANSLPKVCYPGCTIIGCAAGLVNTLKLKGVHNALASGENAAENVVRLMNKTSANKTQTWFMGQIEHELNSVRNACKLLKKYGKTFAALEHFLANMLKLKIQFETCSSDNNSTKVCSNAENLPRDWEVRDSRAEVLRMSRVFYMEDTPHLSVKNATTHKLYDLKIFDKLITRLCPAKVYSWVKVDKHYEFKIQHDNCIQCKSCCVKPAAHTIDWNVAFGGGPDYN